MMQRNCNPPRPRSSTAGSGCVKRNPSSSFPDCRLLLLGCRGQRRNLPLGRIYDQRRAPGPDGRRTIVQPEIVVEARLPVRPRFQAPGGLRPLSGLVQQALIPINGFLFEVRRRLLCQKLLVAEVARRSGIRSTVNVLACTYRTVQFISTVGSRSTLGGSCAAPQPSSRAHQPSSLAKPLLKKKHMKQQNDERMRRRHQGHDNRSHQR